MSCGTSTLGMRPIMNGMPDNLHPMDATYRAVCREREAITAPVGVVDAKLFLPGDRWRNTPIHEAGHAVMARHFNAPVYRVELFDQNSPEWSVAEGVVHLGEPKPDWHKSHADRVEQVTKQQISFTNEITVALVLIYQAGLLAELLAAGTKPPQEHVVFQMGSPDHRLAAHWAGAQENTRMLMACQRVAVGILERRWQTVEWLAKLLEDRKIVSGAAVLNVAQPPVGVH